MKILTFILLFSIAAGSFAQTKDSDKMLKKSFKTSFGVTLNYLLFVPKNYDSSKKYPLVVTLHAAGSDYISQVNNNDQAHPWIEDSIQERVPHFIMAPGLPSGSGAWGGMMGAGTSLSQECKAVIEAIEDLKKTYSLDTNRFIIGGFSIGGAGTYHMLKFMPNYWAAACPVAAGGDSLQFDNTSKPQTPIWHHHGSNDNGGAALIRMSAALVKNHYTVLRVTTTMVLNANSGNGPAQWTREMQKGTKPQDIIYKNATPSYDSVSKAVDAGANYIYQLITGANHEDSRINANHNPLLARWAFSKVKGGGTKISMVPVSSKSAENIHKQYSTVLTFGKAANWVTDRIFTLSGQAQLGQNLKRNSGEQIIIIRKP